LEAVITRAYKPVTASTIMGILPEAVVELFNYCKFKHLPIEDA